MQKPPNHLTKAEAGVVSLGGWYALVLVNGELCGLLDFMFTTGLCVRIAVDGINSQDRRYCYENKEEAELALSSYTNTNEHPTGPWIKCKGRLPNGKHVDMINPYWASLK